MRACSGGEWRHRCRKLIVSQITGQLPANATFTLIEEPMPESVPALERLEAEVVPLHRSDCVERFPEGAPAADVDCLIDDCITGLNKIEDEAPETPPDATA